MKHPISALLITLAFVLCVSAQKTKPKTTPKAPAKPAAPKSTGACPGANSLTAAEIATILAEHNRTRSALGLAKLTWNCSLADTAQAWAKNGEFKHRTDIEYGENMFVSSSSTASIAEAMLNWEKEKSNWNNAAGACAPGKVCTHYTQMVWRSSSAIGCGINRALTGTWKTLMVCTYNPAGNTGGKAF